MSNHGMAFEDFKRLAKYCGVHAPDGTLHEMHDAATCALEAWIERHPDEWEAEEQRYRDWQTARANDKTGG